jgi:hypothetical protein
MNIKERENVEKWAVGTFGTAELGDPRRTDRLVKIAIDSIVSLTFIKKGLKINIRLVVILLVCYHYKTYACSYCRY